MTNNEMPFGERMVRAFEDATVKLIRDGGFIQPNYANRIQIDAALLRDAYAQIDRDRVSKQITALIENKLADALWNAMATEFATDAKKILSDNDLRAEVRVYMRNLIRETSASLKANTTQEGEG